MRLLIQAIPLRANVHKNLLPALRILLALTATVYVVYSLSQLDASVFSTWLGKIKPNTITWLQASVVLILMPLNLGFEVFKWKILSSRLERISLSRIIHSVLYGMTLGMITPKRSGEFAGRIMILQPRFRFRGLLLNTAGGLSQLFITLLMGCISVLFLLPAWQPISSQQLTTGNYGWMITLAAFSASFILLLVLGLPALARRGLPNQNRFLHKVSLQLGVLGKLSPSNIFALFSLSLMRYFVFVVQFYLLLKLFGLAMPFPVLFSLIAVIYLFMALIPLSAIWELGVRGPVALFVFGLYNSLTQDSAYEMPVLAATTALWVVNLAFPAITGGIMGIGKELNSSNS